MNSAILVGQFDSPFVRRVAITLHLYGVAFARDRTSVFSDAMAATHPLVRIPSFITPAGEKLFDSHAILDHLDEQASPAALLTPRAGVDRQCVLQATYMATGAIEKAGAVVYERHFHPGPMLSAEWEARCARQLAGTLAHLESQAHEPWFLGPRMTQADVTLGCLVSYLRLRLPEAFDEVRYPRLARLAARCDSLEAFRVTVPSADEQMPAAASDGSYHSRPIRFLGMHSTRDWWLKTYGIALHGESPRASLVSAALARTAQVLPSRSDSHVGFVIVHDAATVCFANYYWWQSENELHQRVFVSPRERPSELALVADPAAGCVWELEVIDFERRAWLVDVLKRPGTGHSVYLSRQCNADV